MATILHRVNYLNDDDVDYAEREKLKIKDIRMRPGYFVKWTKFNRIETIVGGTVIQTEIEMAIIADAVTGRTHAVKSEYFVVDLDNFVEINKIKPWPK